jgi:hypothetical protein
MCLLPSGLCVLGHQAELPDLLVGGLFRYGMFEARDVWIFRLCSCPAIGARGAAIAPALSHSGKLKRQEQHGNNYTAPHHRTSLWQI